MNELHDPAGSLARRWRHGYESYRAVDPGDTARHTAAKPTTKKHTSASSVGCTLAATVPHAGSISAAARRRIILPCIDAVSDDDDGAALRWSISPRRIQSLRPS